MLIGLMYTLKPTKYGFHLTADGFSDKMALLIRTILETLYKCDIDTLDCVLEVHRKGLESCASEPLKNQSKYLLNTLMSARAWTREQRLDALKDITKDDVINYSKNFLDTHTLECLFYGSISKHQAQEITDQLVQLRAEYLDRRGKELGLKAEVNPILEEWFSNDPVERIVNMQTNIAASKRIQENIALDNSPRKSRTPSPSIR